MVDGYGATKKLIIRRIYPTLVLLTAYCLLPTVYCLLITSCFQPESGCLDIEAKNFELTADEQCGNDDNSGSCPCIYPVISFDTFDYFFTKLDYQPDATYLINNQYINLKSIKFYLSNFRFIRASGESIGVEDTLSLTVLNDENQSVTNIFEDNFFLINQQSSIDIGMVRQSGQFDSLRFVVGIEGAANSANPALIANSRHPLAEESMNFGDQSIGYIFNQIILNKDTSTTEDFILNIGGSANLVEVKLPFSYKSTPGVDFSLGTLRIDHSKWFDGINFVTDNDALMMEKIVANTHKVFSVSK